MLIRVPRIVAPTSAERRALERAHRNGLRVPAVPPNELRGSQFFRALLGQSVGGGGSGPFKRAITIDHTKLGSADLTNFPVLFSGTYSYLATAANGGKLQNASAFDFEFYSDSALTTKLNWQRERHVTSTGQVVYWVQVPSVSHTADTTFYMRYADSGITTDQSNASSTWDSNYKGVYHLGDGSTLSLSDSTSNALTLTNNASLGSVSAVSEKIYGGGQFLKTSHQYLSHADTAALQLTSAWTLSCWITPFSPGAGGYQTLISKGNGSQRNYDMDIEQTTNKLRVMFTQGSGNFKLVSSSNAITLGSESYVCGTYDGSTLTAYINGAADGTPLSVSGACDNTTADEMEIGDLHGSGDYYDGTMDEPRLSSVARSASWILAEYNSQNNPSTFYTVGSEQAA